MKFTPVGDGEREAGGRAAEKGCVIKLDNHCGHPGVVPWAAVWDTHFKGLGAGELIDHLPSPWGLFQGTFILEYFRLGV